jgi:aspartate 1-decarboxylase
LAIDDAARSFHYYNGPGLAFSGRDLERRMYRQFLLGKIHRATITRADLNYVGSITLDPLLIEAAGFMENEKIDIYNITNGSRFSTYVIPGVEGGGEVGINGAAAHLVHPGDLVILASYGWLTLAEAENHRPRIVFVDEKNRIAAMDERERTPVTSVAP